MKPVALPPGRHKAGADWIRDDRKHDGYGARHLQHPLERRAAGGENDVRPQRDQLCCVSANDLRIATAPAIVDADVAPVAPAQLLELFREHCGSCQGHRLVGDAGEGAEAPHPLALLRPRRKRPCGCCAANESDELASPHGRPPQA